MFPKKVTETMKDRIREVGRLRRRAKALRQESRRLMASLPTSKQLAYEAGICVRRVQELMSDTRNSTESVVSRGTIEANQE